ncbi:methylated-DNA--[protein]-cysteine S-methyltransferase [Pontibacter akesuensis]|uniref:DNA-O6-methylguanine--protein-cysteine S-methyltransferase /Transcriptional regulator Ada n=1 Tax=Pontibacter akesuensis TaxID=388950 RepID=A0A1I7G0H9_9BACT|nr:methylated-DNA--[protein]-cysteine S-methyltransferase [Pontibacter akesuensis]GHA59530.1 methylated-DNA--protein-cysteine methyltransferase [Pontibacter akesuensis]SFU41944.1 DNA-O6-methylguanine--protein-cysteine S-methyltransferase /Transcriptional regulator Ada [Pontibacter akesuensis]
MNHYETIANALTYLRENARQQPELEEVAAHVHLSPQHFQRVFAEWAGVSPKKFLQFLTLHHAKAVLAQSASVLDAALSTGLSGSSRLHDLFVSIEGVTPGEFKNQGEALVLKYSFGTCQFGKYIVASTAKGICYLHFYQQEETAVQELQQSWTNALLVPEQVELHLQVTAFWQQSLTPAAGKIKLHLSGTPFQLKVWEALLRIPEAHLSTYGQLAKSIEQPSASRAVGTAIGSNPIAFLIPCHRVIRSVGGIGEYRWGSERKMAMIGWEAATAQSEKQR